MKGFSGLFFQDKRLTEIFQGMRTAAAFVLSAFLVSFEGENIFKIPLGENSVSNFKSLTRKTVEHISFLISQGNTVF